MIHGFSFSESVCYLFFWVGAPVAQTCFHGVAHDLQASKLHGAHDHACAQVGLYQRSKCSGSLFHDALVVRRLEEPVELHSNEHVVEERACPLLPEVHQGFAPARDHLFVVAAESRWEQELAPVVLGDLVLEGSG